MAELYGEKGQEYLWLVVRMSETTKNKRAFVKDIAIRRSYALNYIVCSGL